MGESPYLTIKRSIAGGIAEGRWAAGDMLPSEHALCRSFHVARMTVNRAMRELAGERLVRRVPGLGTFVAESLAQSALVEIRNIADEIRHRGHAHAARVIALEPVAATADTASMFGLAGGDSLFHSAILHCEDAVPIQYEDRLVHPQTAPCYLEQDFRLTTPAEYLNRIAPLRAVEHVVQSVAATADISALLAMAPGDPCLLIIRRTWSAAASLASLGRLYHPGSRYRLTGHFTPAKPGMAEECS